MNEYPQVKEFNEGSTYKWEGFLEEGIVADSGSDENEHVAHGQAMQWLAGASS